MFDYAKDPQITRFTSWSLHQTIENTKLFIEFRLKETMKDPLRPLVVTLREDPSWVIGTVALRAEKEYAHEIAYALGRKYQNKGYMHEAVQPMLQYGFNILKLKRIYGTCIKENVRSKRVMERGGMRYEGCMRSATYAHEKFHDVEIYAILDSDFFSEPPRGKRSLLSAQPKGYHGRKPVEVH